MTLLELLRWAPGSGADPVTLTSVSVRRTRPDQAACPVRLACAQPLLLVPLHPFQGARKDETPEAPGGGPPCLCPAVSAQARACCLRRGSRGGGRWPRALSCLRPSSLSIAAAGAAAL